MAIIFCDVRIVNEGTVSEGDVRVREGRIAAVGGTLAAARGDTVIEGRGRLLMPGLIDDQVHFREPGLTHKADIASESRAAAAGGITSFMDMPNVLPPTLDMTRLQAKRRLAAATARINYAFYLGASNDNIAAIAAADPTQIAGVKIFMGASTGNMLVDDEKILEAIFRAAPTLIAIHCESTPRINTLLQQARTRFDGAIPAAAHPQIRDAEACYLASARAIKLARQTGARLHILHLSTERELALFDSGETADKQITAEACLHHLLFDDGDYAALGMRLKTNPAIKSRNDRQALRQAVAAGRIDVLATDHAPHLPAEKDLPYEQAAAGMPLAEYALPGFLELVADGALTYPQVAARTAHMVAELFAIKERGYIREGYWADLTLVSSAPGGVPIRPAVLSKCAWTPFAGRSFRHMVDATFVNGRQVWEAGIINDEVRGMALEFAR